MSSNKRFECDSQDVQFGIVADGELILVNPSYVVNLLNSLSDDVKHLEEYCGDVEADVKRLQEENERLKQELNECANHKLYSRRKLEKENKELKQQLDKIPENIRKVWLE